MRRLLLLSAALAAAMAARAAVDSPHLFDGNEPAPGAAPLVLSGAAPDIGPAGPVGTPVPADLAAAGLRLGNRVQLARLAATPRADGPVAFAVIGDAEPGRFFWERWFNHDRHAFEKALARARARNPEFVVQLGDYVSRGIAENFRKGVSFLDQHPGGPILHVQGNHDRSEPNGPADKNLFRAVFGPGDYYVDRGGWRFIVLDSADYEVTDAQLDWLDKVLTTDGPSIVFTHIPPIYLDGKIKSQGPRQKEIDVQAAKDWSDAGMHAEFLSAFFDSGAARFREIVDRHRVARVYMGHIHAFGTATVDGVRYVLSGCGGSPHYPLPPWYPTRKKDHYIMVTAGPGHSVTETVHELDGTTFPIAW
ncbi:MAG: metallophosphoesterase [Elusimicrobia bacterium]|nr:metallophosphoesterase [Elusimicrobiota bacterium]